MPRLIDMLDVAAGRTPEILDDPLDYLVQRPSPPKLIGEDQRYAAGWLDRFDGELNLEASGAFDLALQRWFHLTLDTPDHYIVANVADLGKASNTALLVCDKATGDIREASLTDLGPQGDIETSDDLRTFRDLGRHSFIKVDAQDQRFEFSVHAQDLHLSGTARHALGPPFVQITRFHRGRGSLQWYGNLRIEHATLTLGERVIPLPPDALGAYDRTVGHQRGIQNWNWIALSGPATDVDSGEVLPIGIQVAVDRAGARPMVRSKKHVLWLDGRVRKVPTAAFDYEITDPDTRATGPWRVTSEPGEQTALDLTFTPKFQRRERRRAVVVRADFNQYYGPVHGTVTVDGRTLRLDGVFAVVEDSLLEL